MSTDFPDYLKTLFLEKRYFELAVLFRAMSDSNKALFAHAKQQTGAIRRVKTEFTKITGRQPYKPGTDEIYWDGQIGRYAKLLGVPALLSDLHAGAKYKPQSLVYFLHAGNGKACRWEMLLRRKMEQEIARQRQEDEQAYAALGQLLGGMFEPKKMQLEPDWVVKAKKQKAYLEQRVRQGGMTQRDLYAAAREIKTISSRLANWENEQK